MDVRTFNSSQAIRIWVVGYRSNLLGFFLWGVTFWNLSVVKVQHLCDLTLYWVDFCNPFWCIMSLIFGQCKNVLFLQIVNITYGMIYNDTLGDVHYLRIQGYKNCVCCPNNYKIIVNYLLVRFSVMNILRVFALFCYVVLSIRRYFFKLS